ncbi:MAG TPA: hypothetical protein VFF06_24160 [Polyangia bacterium]|nr:hypothetical protein [Polyangia bacterium]
MRGALAAALAAIFFAAVFGGALGACESGEALAGCARDSDCPAGAHCVTATGVCVDFRNPLDAAVPDLAGADGPLSD